MSQQSLGDELSLDEVSDAELEAKISQNDENSSVMDNESESSESSEEINEDDENLATMNGGGDESEGYEEDEDENFGVEEQKGENPREIAKSNPKQLEEILSEDDDDDDDEPDENYLMKFDKEIRKNYLIDFHPETLTNNYAEIQSLVNIVRDDRGIIVDEFHKTLPFLTKYEKTRILGQRTKQLNSGSKPYIDIKDVFDGKRIIDGALIAQKELEWKKIPFIIRRPLPNGSSEYWRLEDLELIN